MLAERNCKSRRSILNSINQVAPARCSQSISIFVVGIYLNVVEMFRQMVTNYSDLQTVVLFHHISWPQAVRGSGTAGRLACKSKRNIDIHPPPFLINNSHSSPPSTQAASVWTPPGVSVGLVGQRHYILPLNLSFRSSTCPEAGGPPGSLMDGLEARNWPQFCHQTLSYFSPGAGYCRGNI